MCPTLFVPMCPCRSVKCGSSTAFKFFEKLEDVHNTTFRTLHRINNVKSDDDHMPIHGDCTFAFVRDPLHRLVSAYYTIHAMMLVDPLSPVNLIVNRWKWWNVTTEPERFHSFVNQLKSETNEFLGHHPLQHVITISGQLSLWYGSDIQFIGRTERLSEHWNILSHYDKCQDFVKISNATLATKEMGMEVLIQIIQDKQRSSMGNVANWLNITNVTKNGIIGNKLELPPYQAIMSDQTLYNDIVEHYWQDYVCFGYNTTHPELGRNYTGRFKMPY